MLFYVFEARKCKLEIIKLWPQSHAFRRYHHPAFGSFVNSDPKFWILVKNVDVNIRSKEKTLGIRIFQLGFGSSLKMYFHFYMKRVLDMIGSEDIYLKIT